MKHVDRTRSFAIRAESIDEERRTVRARFFTDAPVAMPDFDSFRVIDEVLLPSGAVLPDHVPMFDSHDRWDGAHAVMGSVEDMVTDTSGGDCTLRFCAHPDPESREERLWTKVRERHIRSVSVGYSVISNVKIPAHETRTVEGREWKAGSRVLHVVTKWLVKEVSPCAIPADSGAKIRARALISWRLRMDKNLAALNAAVDAQVSDSKPVEAVIAAAAATSGLDEAKVTAALAGDEMLSAEDLAALAAALGVTLESEPAMASDAAPAEAAKSQPAKSDAPARADELGIERRAREAKAAADLVMAFAPTGLRAEAETMLLRGISPEVIRARLLALQAERMKPVGTPEATQPPGKPDASKPTAITAADFGRAFFAGFGAAASK